MAVISEYQEVFSINLGDNCSVRKLMGLGVANQIAVHQPFHLRAAGHHNLLDGAGAFHAHIGGDYVLIDVAVQVDHVGFFGFDQHRRMRGADDA